MDVEGRVCIEVRRLPDRRWTFVLRDRRRSSTWARVVRPLDTFATWRDAWRFADDLLDSPPGLLDGLGLFRSTIGR